MNTSRTTSWLLRRISVVLLLLVLILAIYGTLTFPDTIPVHFNAKGQPDGWGSPSFLLILPVIGFGIYFLFSWIIKRPQLMNYPVKPSPENAERLFAISRMMFSVLMVCISFLFLMIIGSTYMVVYGYADGLPWWFIFLVLVIIPGPVFYFIYQMLRTGSRY